MQLILNSFQQHKARVSRTDSDKSPLHAERENLFTVKHLYRRRHLRPSQIPPNVKM